MRLDSKFVQEILALKGKKSAAEIAEVFGTTRNAIIGIWYRHQPRKWSAGEVYAVRAKHLSRQARERFAKDPSSYGWALYWKRKKAGADEYR